MDAVRFGKLAASAFIGLSTLYAGASAQPLVVPTPIIKPASPISPWISPANKTQLVEFFAALKRKEYALADIQRRSLDDPMARSVADWAYLRLSKTTTNSTEIGAFLDTHYGWPNANLMQSKVEKAFDDEVPGSEILAFFDKRDPITANGHVHLARAFLETGNETAARAQLKSAWVDFDWPARAERNFLNRYGRFLNQDLHWAKADRQLFEVKATSTERLIPYLDKKHQDEVRVRSAFLKLDHNAVALYKKLPQSSALDSGVLLAAARYYRRTGKEDIAIVYASLAPIDRDLIRNADAWYYERSRLARWALKTGRFEDAYTVSAYSGLESGAKFAEAEFMAGWVALRFLNDPERAKAHFAFLTTGVTSPISLARGEYWLGRAWAASGDQAVAAQHYQVAGAYPFAFYGQLAIDELGPNAVRQTFPTATTADETQRLVFESRPMVHAMRILSEIDQDTHFDRFARQLDDQIESVGEVEAYFDLVINERKTYLAVRAGKVARNNGAEVPSVIYPLIPVPASAKRFAEESLILGLSRQESEFNTRAYSRARARGLMQLLDSTAKITARKEGIPYSTRKLMDDPNYNMTIGAAHLSHLIERFRGSFIMVLAGYNAGPHRVTQWIETYGDPRDPSVDPLDWIELIPFSETRNYVMRVLENTQVYRARLTGEPIGGRLATDLTRGGNTPDSFGIYPPTPQLLKVSVKDGGGPNIWVNKPKVPPRAVEQYEELKFPPLAPDAVNTSE